MATLDGGAKEERLPVLLSGIGGVKLLGVPALPQMVVPTTMGSIIADATVKILDDWGVKENIVGMVFDTTSVNTGQCMALCLNV